MNRLTVKHSAVYFSCAVAVMAAADEKTYVNLSVNQSQTAYWDGSQWSDREVPDPSKDYKVRGWFGIYPRNENNDGSETSRANPLAFPGNSLTLGDSSGTGELSAYMKGTSYYSFPREGLICNRGRLSLYNTYQTTYFLGTITVQTKKTAANDRTFTFDIGNKYYSHMHIEAKMNSASDCRSIVTGIYAPQTVYFEGDMSEYNGTLSVISPTVTLNTTFATEMPGTLACETNATLTTSASSDIVRVGNLSLADGTIIKLQTDENSGTNAQYIVSGDVLTHGKVHVVATDYFTRSGSKAKSGGAAWETAGTPWRSPFITAPKGAIDESAFVFDKFEDTHNTSDSSVFYRGVFNAHFELEENADGTTETLYFVQEPIVVCVSTVDFSNTYSYDTYSKYSVCTNASDWSDGKLPHPGAHYLVKYLPAALSPAKKSGTPLFATPQNVDDYVFPGDSLTLGGANAHIASLKSAEFAHLRSVNSRLFFYRDNFELRGGKLEIVSSSDGSFFYATEDKRVKVYSDLVGDGLLQVGGQATYGGWTVGGETEFLGDNSGFAGRLVLTSWPRGNYNPTGNYPFTGERVYLHSATDIGGPLSEFDHDALTLSKYASLRPCVSMTLADETRGLLVSGKGDITVTNGVTLTVKTPMTYAGELTKNGDGVLALCSSPRFIDGDEATLPQEGTNLLTVVAGGIKPMTTDSLKNLAVSFASGSELVYDAVPADSDMAAYGFCGVASMTAEDKISVSVDISSLGGSTKSFTVNLFTLDSDEAMALAGRMRFVKPLPGMRAGLSYATVGGKTTVSARYSVCGMKFILQ